MSRAGRFLASHALVIFFIALFVWAVVGTVLALRAG